MNFYVLQHFTRNIKYEWAKYSQEREAMFCFACRHFAPPAYGNADKAFIKSGFKRWKKAHGKDGVILKHLNSQFHKLSFIAWTGNQCNVAEKTSVAQFINLAFDTTRNVSQRTSMEAATSK